MNAVTLAQGSKHMHSYKEHVHPVSYRWSLLHTVRLELCRCSRSLDYRLESPRYDNPLLHVDHTNMHGHAVRDAVLTLLEPVAR